MSEDLVKQLSSYRAQLQQVEAALSTDPDNEDLLKLQKDLQEVIELTKDLLTSQPAEGVANANSSDAAPPKSSWRVGDHCMSVWSQDGQLYEAEIEEIDVENGTAAITFLGYGNAEVVPLHALRPAEQGKTSKDEGTKPKSKKELLAEQREYKKKKAQKKVQRLKELEQEREDQKSKWQQFNNKAYSKNKKGQVKRSIFASPESVNGKVGVGTCGIADKPMTQYHDTSKYNVRHLMPQ
ncbi:survival of motor neuron-related-splicing factor 30 [Salminus brasiliensis]|uniref:survival of motor neuron-related-splicing factor 30 n=1 Tax=Salminus brasiliensis TaxID=930266 RepID=UPI003B836414